MKYTRIKIIFLAIIFFGIFGSVKSSKAATINVVDASGQPSCELIDVQAAVDASASGDTVRVPAGSCTWNLTLTIKKGIILQGNGVDSTIITSGGGTIIIFYNPTTPSLNETFRLTGFTLNGNSRTVTGAVMQNSSAASIISNIRIDHNKIYGCAGKEINVFGLVYGLIDNNILMANSGVANRGVFYISGRNQYSWAIPLEVGSANSLYIEDNVISGTNGWWVTQTNEGARWVFRHNTVDLTSVDGNLDWHGNQPQDTSNVPTSCLPSNPNNARGVVGVEVYGNTLTNISNNNNAIGPRGGTSIIYDNTLTANYSFCNTPIIVMSEEDASPTSYGACSPLKTDYPGYDSVIGYFWNNLHKYGSNDWTRACIGYNYPTDPTMIPEKVNYWADTQRNSVNATAYWTSGVAANRNLSTCTAQDVYWETDTNKLYRCTATNVWTFIYTPFNYPHPFITDCVNYQMLCDANSAPPADTTPPAAPTGVAVN